MGKNALSQIKTCYFYFVNLHLTFVYGERNERKKKIASCIRIEMLSIHFWATFLIKFQQFINWMFYHKRKFFYCFKQITDQLIIQ